MRLDAVVVGGVLLIVAVVALVVVLIQRADLSDSEMVQALGGAQPAAAPAAPPPAPMAVAAPAPLEPLPPSAIAVYFDFDRAELPAAESAKLARMLEGSFKRIDAVGHADRIGPAAYNRALSQRRADSVRDYLVRNKIAAAIIHTGAKGEVEPASGDACIDMGPQRRANRALVECLQPDRRVDVTFVRGL
jgi:OOP family OmpA-OmpF porin